MESKVWVFWLPSVLINSSIGRAGLGGGAGWQRARVAIISRLPLPTANATRTLSQIKPSFLCCFSGGLAKNHASRPTHTQAYRHTRTQTLCSAGDKFDGKRNYEGVAVVAAAADDVLPSPIPPPLPCKDMTL